MFKKLIHSNIGAAAWNMLVAYLVWMLSRVAFVAENWSTFVPYMSWPLFKSMLRQLYNPAMMATDLTEAHQANGCAVLAVDVSMGIRPEMSDDQIAPILLRERVRLSMAKIEKY